MLAGGSVHKYPDQPALWLLDIGLAVRLPLVVGIACCVLPGDD